MLGSVVLWPGRGDHSVAHDVIVPCSAIWKITPPFQCADTFWRRTTHFICTFHTHTHTHTYQRRLVLTEPKEETTTGLLWVWSSWEPAAGPHARSIHQFGFVSVHQLCEWVIAFEVHCTSVCVCVSSTVPCSCSNTDTHLQIQMAKHSTRLEANSRDSVRRVFTDSETCRSGCEINTGAGTPFK